MRLVFIGLNKVIRTIELVLQIIHEKSIRKDFKKFGREVRIKYDTKFHNRQYISIGDKFSADYRVKIDAWDEYGGKRYTPEIIVGDNVSLNADCYISSINKIEIGDGVMMGRNVFITDHMHGKTELSNVAPGERELYSKGNVYIGNNVLIGSNVCIMPGVVIGDNCIIGANSVVTKSFDSNVCITGIPARVCKKLE